MVHVDGNFTGMSCEENKFFQNEKGKRLDNGLSRLWKARENINCIFK